MRQVISTTPREVTTRIVPHRRERMPLLCRRFMEQFPYPIRTSPGRRRPLCTRPRASCIARTRLAPQVNMVWRPIPEVGRMDNLECWENTLFRNEGGGISSALIRSATAMTFRAWGWPPRDGLISAIGIDATRRRRSKNALPGVCFQMADWIPFSRIGDRSKVWYRAPHPMRIPRAKSEDDEARQQKSVDVR
jgi:hypothetical protein